MQFEDTQSFYKERLDADSWFTTNGITVHLSKSAKAGDVSVINDDIESDLRSNGMAFVVKAPRLNTIAESFSQRSLYYSITEVLILENPERNRESTGLNVTGMVAVVETLKALVGHVEIRNSDMAYQETEGPSGLIVYIVRTEAECDLIPR